MNGKKDVEGYTSPEKREEVGERETSNREKLQQKGPKKKKRA